MSVLERVREQEVLAEHEEPRASLAEARRRLKRGVVDRIGLATVARMVGEGDLARMRQELGIAAEALLNGPGFAEIGPKEHERLVREVLDEILGLGPIQPLLDDLFRFRAASYREGGFLVSADLHLGDGHDLVVPLVLPDVCQRLRRHDEIRIDPCVSDRVIFGVGLHGQIHAVRYLAESGVAVFRYHRGSAEAILLDDAVQPLRRGDGLADRHVAEVYVRILEIIR